MSDTPANKALEGYFDDLLSDTDGDSAQYAELPEKIETSAADDSEVATGSDPIEQSKVTPENQRGDEPSTLSEASDNSGETISKPENSASPSPTKAEAPVKTPERDVVSKFTPKPRIKTKPVPRPESMESNLAILEEHKRQKLQRMLSQQTVSKAPQPEVKVEVKAPPVEIPVETPSEAPEQVDIEHAEVVQDVVADEVIQAQDFLSWADNGRPMWAQNAFEALLFEVAGLKLAVPLVALGQIVPLNKKLTILQGQSEWFMGILPSTIGDIRTVNTALFVMPERYKSSFLESAKYVVTIDGMPWGLAVDTVNQPVTLEPDDVNWRSERTSRPWLAGTVKSHMCALIDIPQMAQLLDSCDKNRSPR